MSPAERQLADSVAQAQLNMIAARQQVVAALRMHGRTSAAEVDKRAERVAKFDRREAVDQLVEYQSHAVHTVAPRGGRVTAVSAWGEAKTLE